MARFFGVVGFSEGQVETAASVYEEGIVERELFGDIVRDTRQLESGDKVLPDIAVNNSISVLADAYANEHFHAIRYVKWAGVLRIVTDVEVQRPRLLLRLGGVYHGPTPAGQPVEGDGA